MTETSARFALPFLQPGQAQKEIYHNEALALLDIAVNASVQSADASAPPEGPTLGNCWIVAAGATGAWAGRSGTIAGWTSGGWRFIEPSEGMLVWNVATGLWLQRIGAAWVAGQMAASSIWIGGVQVIGPRGAAIVTPDGGTSVDSEARAAITSILQTLRTHGLIAS